MVTLVTGRPKISIGFGIEYSAVCGFWTMDLPPREVIIDSASLGLAAFLHVIICSNCIFSIACLLLALANVVTERASVMRSSFIVV